MPCVVAGGRRDGALILGRILNRCQTKPRSVRHLLASAILPRLQRNSNVENFSEDGPEPRRRGKLDYSFELTPETRGNLCGVRCEVQLNPLDVIQRVSKILLFAAK